MELLACAASDHKSTTDANMFRDVIDPEGPARSYSRVQVERLGCERRKTRVKFANASNPDKPGHTVRAALVSEALLLAHHVTPKYFADQSIPSEAAPQSVR